MAEPRPVLTDCGERRLDAGGNLEIVEADDRKILRNALVRLLYGFHHADSQQI